MRRLFLVPLILVHVALIGRAAWGVPPFAGTIFLDADILTDADPTAFEHATYAGQGFRWMFDRRINDWAYLNAYLIDATFDDGLSTEIQVNPEFGSADAALEQALKYGPIIGRLPTALRVDAETVWIHQGVQPFGGGNNNLLIHTGQADLYAADGILEETLIHEATHTSLDEQHASAPGWLAAQASDGEYISTYARDNPQREDVAESFLPYLAVRYRSDRIEPALFQAISQTIPNRIEYFDSQAFDMYPWVTSDFLAGDIDRDGDVDRGDVFLMSQHFGLSSGATWETGDFNNDGMTTLADLGLLQAHLGQAPLGQGQAGQSAAVPEPSGWMVVAMVLILALVWPRGALLRRGLLFR